MEEFLYTEGIQLSYFLMDFDLVFDKMREMMRKDKPYQKKLALVTIFIDISQKQ